jgi:hypothetical protein
MIPYTFNEKVRSRFAVHRRIGFHKILQTRIKTMSVRYRTVPVLLYTVFRIRTGFNADPDPALKRLRTIIMIVLNFQFLSCLSYKLI